MPSDLSTRSLLVIGATGRIGQAVVTAAVAHTPPLPVHVFARTPSKLPTSLAELCASTIQGDARDTAVVADALSSSGATDVALCTGIPGLEPTDLRGATGQALASAIKKQRDEEGKRTRVVVVSALGAGGSVVRFGWGIGSLIMWGLRFQLRDHDVQEHALQEAFQDWTEGLLIVRPTQLTDGNRKGGVCVMGEGGNESAWRVDRADLAEWIVAQVCGEGEYFGKTPGITGKL